MSNSLNYGLDAVKILQLYILSRQFMKICGISRNTTKNSDSGYYSVASRRVKSKLKSCYLNY